LIKFAVHLKMLLLGWELLLTITVHC